MAIGTEEAYLDDVFVGEPDPGARAWILSEVFSPYGDAGFIPAIRALLDRQGRVNGFDFWIGAAGD